MQCSKCGTENPEGNIMCSSCGEKLSKPQKQTWTQVYVRYWPRILLISIVVALIWSALARDLNPFTIGGRTAILFIVLIVLLNGYWFNKNRHNRQ